VPFLPVDRKRIMADKKGDIGVYAYQAMKRDLDISQLSPAECILLAEELWDRARNHPDAIPLPFEHLAEIERRIEAIDSGAMGSGESWEAVRLRLFPLRK
jgi:putative addiction module component (TIGR02574 family)